MPVKQPRHKYAVGTDLKIVKDLSGEEPEVVGHDARVDELLPTRGRYPQYKVVIFGDKTGKGGVFEVDERELGAK